VLVLVLRQQAEVGMVWDGIEVDYDIGNGTSALAWIMVVIISSMKLWKGRRKKNQDRLVDG
jgi:hypothetical protein